MEFFLQPFGVNYAYLSLPTVWMAAYVPHFIKMGYLYQKGVYEHTQPRDLLKNLGEQKKLSEPELKLVSRITGAHFNGLEIFGGYSAAVIFAVSRGVSVDYLNKMALAFTASRLVYNVVYIQFGDIPSMSLVRTGVFMAGVGMICHMFIKACLAK